MENLGSLLNGVVNFNTWLPEPSMYFDGTKTFFETYAKRAVEAKVDPLGYYLAPFGSRWGQMIEQAVNANQIARPENPGKVSAREHAPDHHRSGRLFGGWRVKETATLELNSAASRTRTSISSAPRASR